MRKALIFAGLYSLLCPNSLQAAFDSMPVDPKGIAMSGAMTALSGNASGLFYNPASSATGQSFAGISYAVPYGDSTLRNLSGAVTLGKLPFDRRGALSVGINRYHADSYHEETIVAGYARELLPKVRAGLAVSRMTQKIDGFGEHSATGVNAGLQADLTPALTIAVSSTNLNAPTIGAAKSKLPRTTLTGISYRLETGSMLTVNAQTAPGHSARLLAAGDFPVYRSLHLMIGTATNPSLISAGASFGSGRLKATAAVSRHIDLGTTSALGVEVSW
ncbi:MAG: hypothetical protein HGB06_01055 [Chlorobaculum sp.]|nr:hypothetical protein [Chlorobaculum sp.]